MSASTHPLLNLDDAKRLGDLVYTAYGLTYHRSFMYEPEHLLELNLRGKIRSILAKDDNGAVVGHMATIRPWFESIPEDVAALAPTSVEIGLSIVHPGHRGQNLQTAIGLACLMNEQEANPRLANMFAKCLTVHTHSQKSARSMLGRSCALLLGSVPSWVNHESGDRPEPMTTVVLQSPCTTDHRTLYVNPKHTELVQTLLDSSMLRRTVAPVMNPPALAGATRLSHWFEPSRRRGVVHVWEAGESLARDVVHTVHWLVDGHMEHVTVLLPANEPGVVSVLPQLEEAGLFFGGFLPDLEGRDVLVMEFLAWDRLDVENMDLLGDETKRLQEAVVADWRRTRGPLQSLTGRALKAV